MKIFKQAIDMNIYLDSLRNQGKTIGFVPTMGALHQGHASLIHRSLEKADISVVSIFVNPTQFNQKEDLDQYPRTTETDVALLSANRVDVLYLPDVQDIYGQEPIQKFEIDLGYLDQIMEGEFRPGHFQGVAQVVHLLLQRVKPDYLFMGQKDYQQIAVVRKMIGTMGHRTELVMCPIIRNPNGLAMSSRNARLTPEVKSKASILYHTLLYAKCMKGIFNVDYLENKCLNMLDRKPFKPEYFKIVNAEDLKEIQSWSDAEQVVACTAVWADDIRLIDNMQL